MRRKHQPQYHTRRCKRARSQSSLKSQDAQSLSLTCFSPPCAIETFPRNTCRLALGCSHCTCNQLCTVARGRPTEAVVYCSYRRLSNRKLPTRNEGTRCEGSRGLWQFASPLRVEPIVSGSKPLVAAIAALRFRFVSPSRFAEKKGAISNFTLQRSSLVNFADFRFGVKAQRASRLHSHGAA